MNILIIGYGKMGKIIEQLAKERNHNIVGIIDKDDNLEQVEAEDIDVAIEFTTPNSAFDNIKTCLKKGIPIVVGTTGWYDRLDEVKSLVEKYNGSLIYATNFAIGVYIFRQLNSFLAKKMENFPNYTPSITEIHHIHKLDAPSGTAITLANELIKENSNISSWQLNEISHPWELKVTSIREGEEFGTHIITYESSEDVIEIKHKAKSRRGLALGAVVGAEFISTKKGIYSLNDMFE
ncbi:MAG: 4-hydroxy-tetrahydrodipicolinate reductase [Bacteroidota bacterium]|nr:4-hydroxy-tetrahydrodipicolinate reductase [Bacteroidota bacterium]